MSIENNNMNRDPDFSTSAGFQKIAEEAQNIRINPEFFAGTKAVDQSATKEKGSEIFKTPQQIKEELENELIKVLHLEQNKENRKRRDELKVKIQEIKKELYN